MGLDFSMGSSMGNTPQAGSGYSAEKNEIEALLCGGVLVD